MNEAGHEALGRQDEASTAVEPPCQTEAEAAAAEAAEAAAEGDRAEAAAEGDRAEAAAEGDRAEAEATEADAATPTPTDPAGTASPGGAAPPAPKPATGEVRRQLDRPPAERYRSPEPAVATPSGRRRLAIAAGAAVATALVTFALITFDIGAGLLVIGMAGGWVVGLAATGGAPAGKGDQPGMTRGAEAAAMAGAAIAVGLLLDALRAYALHGVLLPWEYALARFDVVAPLAIVLAAVAAWLRGR